MNKLNKIGVSALCGSLAAISAANAGDLTVTGGVDMSWISKKDDVTGNPIGMGSNQTFKGSGELDWGWTFDYTVAMLNQDAYSSAAVSVGIAGVLIETHNNPDKAPSDGPCMLPLKNLQVLLEKLIELDFVTKNY